MKVVRDPVHGYIELDELAQALLDTPQMQRLRRIRQLGLSHLVYPGANHTRFEHSLGTYHLTCQLLKQIDISQTEEIKAAALLHDVGHGPFSHVTEELIRRYSRHGHEEISHILKQPEIATVLDEFSIKPSYILSHLKGETTLGNILNSEIDMDRMDYLVRDAHYTGVAYGVIDLERLIHSLNFHEGIFVIGAGGLQAAESLLVSRFFMHPTVYYHHVSRIAETMLLRACEHAISEGILDPAGLQFMDDGMLETALLQAGGYAGDLIDRIRNRKLFKRSLYASLLSVSGDVVERYRSNPKRLEKELADEAGVPEGYVLVDIPDMPDMTEMKAMIVVNGKLVNLEQVSPIVNNLEQAHMDNWRMGVYTLPEYRDSVTITSRQLFQVRKDTRQLDFSEMLGN
ncbi:MAG: HD domain-containing protein [Methanosarcinales archaeon]|nr:HD domain-containing protein [Methanosarcinales archaeon]